MKAYIFLADYQTYAMADIGFVADVAVVTFGRDPLTIPGRQSASAPPRYALRLREPMVWRQADGLAVVEGRYLTDFNRAKDVG